MTTPIQVSCTTGIQNAAGSASCAHPRRASGGVSCDGCASGDRVSPWGRSGTAGTNPRGCLPCGQKNPSPSQTDRMPGTARCQTALEQSLLLTLLAHRLQLGCVVFGVCPKSAAASVPHKRGRSPGDWGARKEDDSCGAYHQTQGNIDQLFTGNGHGNKTLFKRMEILFWYRTARMARGNLSWQLIQYTIRPQIAQSDIFPLHPPRGILPIMDTHTPFPLHAFLSNRSFVAHCPKRRLFPIEFPRKQFPKRHFFQCSMV